MNLNNLSTTTTKSHKRHGRGYGCGKGGHTSGRGAKGQKARSKVPLYFEGAPMRKTLIRRLPMLRGKLRFKSTQGKPILITLDILNLFKDKSKVDIKALIKLGLINQEDQYVRIKILNTGELKKSLKVSLPTSIGAAKAIKKAGGEVIQAKEEKKSVSKSKKQ